MMVMIMAIMAIPDPWEDSVKRVPMKCPLVEQDPKLGDLLVGSSRESGMMLFDHGDDEAAADRCLDMLVSAICVMRRLLLLSDCSPPLHCPQTSAEKRPWAAHADP